MIRIEAHLRLNPAGAMEVGVGRVPGYKAVRASADRVRAGALMVFYADFSVLRKSLYEPSMLLEPLKAARSGGFIES
jgi:hypothetical protein